MASKNPKAVSDAVPIEDAAPPKKGEESLPTIGRFKVILSLFLIFVLVVSDLFVNNALNWFPGTLEGRTVTNFGVVVQGIFLVILFILVNYLIGVEVI